MDRFREDIDYFHLRIGLQKTKHGIHHAVGMTRLVGYAGKPEPRPMPVILKLHLGRCDVKLVLNPCQSPAYDASLVLQALRPI